MIKIPDNIMTSFNDLLVKKAIDQKYHHHYRKWLRYYLDFCYKYKYSKESNNSLPYFIKKLQEKNQNQFQQKQAAHAISFYYEITHRNIEENLKIKHTCKVEQKDIKNQNKLLQQTLATKSSFNSLGNNKTFQAWKSAHIDLCSAIKMRHYSPKTLKSYVHWLRKFQYFLKNKDPQLLTPHDVKEFLTFLAVKQNVSASTQNQAFNALLFFYRHIIKKDFGEHKDIVRAKRKKYIPVVLARGEIDAITENLLYPYDLVVKLLYGCGLRLFECLNLRLNNFNFDNCILTVHDGKGMKDRTMPLPEKILPEIHKQFEKVKALHKGDLKAYYAGAFMFGSLKKNIKIAQRSWSGNGFFQQKS